MESITSTYLPLVERSTYGNKAYSLAWLARTGYNVPLAILLSPQDIQNLEVLGALELKKLLNLLGFDNREIYDVAIRSSATCEDQDSESFAGQFSSILGEMSFEELVINIQKVSQNLDTTNCQVAVIIQKRIIAEFSGIIFSSDPLSFAKNQAIINAVKGFGQDLTSGKVSGENIYLQYDENLTIISNNKLFIKKESIEQLWNISKQIEDKLNKPVDIEWCIDKKGELFLLQCRPITGRPSSNTNFSRVCLKSKHTIHPLVQNNKKIWLRLIAELNNVPISHAYLLVADCKKNKNFNKQLHLIKPAGNCDSYSLVLIHPTLLNGKVIRVFSNKENLVENIANIISQVRAYYWDAIILIQEIFDPEFTGIIKLIDQNYLIEIAKGHFLPKGLVSPSIYLLDPNSSIISRNEVRQAYFYKITYGEVLHEAIRSQDEKGLLPSDTILQKITSTFSGLLSLYNVAIEFGVLLPTTKIAQPFIYLIDTVEAFTNISLENIASGIVSRGMIAGIVTYIDVDESNNNTNLHFHDQLTFSSDSQENCIFVCERPDINLLNLIKHFDPSKIGFVFRYASILSHFPILLREKGIPAIQLENWNKLKPGQFVQIDAIGQQVCAQDRISVL